MSVTIRYPLTQENKLRYYEKFYQKLCIFDEIALGSINYSIYTVPNYYDCPYTVFVAYLKLKSNLHQTKIKSILKKYHFLAFRDGKVIMDPLVLNKLAPNVKKRVCK